MITLENYPTIVLSFIVGMLLLNILLVRSVPRRTRNHRKGKRS